MRACVRAFVLIVQIELGKGGNDLFILAPPIWIILTTERMKEAPDGKLFVFWSRIPHRDMQNLRRLQRGFVPPFQRVAGGPTSSHQGPGGLGWLCHPQSSTVLLSSLKCLSPPLSPLGQPRARGTSGKPKPLTDPKRDGHQGNPGMAAIPVGLHIKTCGDLVQPQILPGTLYEAMTHPTEIPMSGV